MFPDGPALPASNEWIPGGQILDVSKYRRVSVEMYYMNDVPGSIGETGQAQIMPVGSSVVAEPAVAAVSWFPWDWEDDSASAEEPMGQSNPTWFIADGVGESVRVQAIRPKTWLMPLCTNYAPGGEGIGHAFVRLRKTLDVTDVRWLQFWVREYGLNDPGNLELSVIGAV
jgi:hypothetical protein